MLSEYSIRQRAITWYAIAYNMSMQGNHQQAAVPYAKAQAYMHTLNIPHSKSCGIYSVQSLEDYAISLVEKYNESARELELQWWIDKNIDPDFCIRKTA